ncbi:hypothetical protein KI387_004559, partial [Taxus chinensis]
TFKDELKNVDLALNMCAAPDVIINTITLAGEDDVLKAVKNETLGHVKRLTLIAEKHNVLTIAQDMHKEKIKYIDSMMGGCHIRD